MENKTIELYGYEDQEAKTELNINNGEIIFQQRDISNINAFLKIGIYIIQGYIFHGEDNNQENILKLNKWARVKGNEKEWLKKIEIKICRNGYVIRHFIFNSFIVDYTEFFHKGVHRFNLILRQYKLAPLEGKGATGTTKVESYIKQMNIKGVEGTLIIKPVDIDVSTTLMSASNFLTGISLLGSLTLRTPIGLSFIFIAHGTGLITEFMADCYFTLKGQPSNMGSFNITRDWVYKPLGNIIKEWIKKENSFINLSDNLGEDIYNMGNLAFASIDLGGKLLNKFKSFGSKKGEGIIYTIRMKKVKVSHYGKQLQPKKYIGLTPLKAIMEFIQEMGFDSYITKKSFEGEVNKKQN